MFPPTILKIIFSYFELLFHCVFGFLAYFNSPVEQFEEKKNIGVKLFFFKYLEDLET